MKIWRTKRKKNEAKETRNTAHQMQTQTTEPIYVIFCCCCCYIMILGLFVYMCVARFISTQVLCARLVLSGCSPFALRLCFVEAVGAVVVAFVVVVVCSMPDGLQSQGSFVTWYYVVWVRGKVVDGAKQVRGECLWRMRARATIEVVQHIC